MLMIKNFESLRSALIVSACTLLALAVVACEPAHHHQEGAHVHGVVRLNIAIDGERQLGVELHAPAESIYGFEYEAATEADRQRQADALGRLKNDFGTLLGIDASAGCKVVSNAIEVHDEDHHDVAHAEHSESRDHAHDGEDHKSEHDSEHHANKRSGEHREVHVEYMYECDRAIAGSQLRPRLHEAFSGIESIQIQILSDALQKSSVISRKDAGDARIQL